MDPVHSWQALLNVLGTQEARSTGHKRPSGSTPLSGAQLKANHAASTPYYTPAQLGSAPGAAVTPVDAWYSIISSLKGHSAGGHGSPAAHLTRGPNSPSSSSHGSSPGTVRQQLFQTAAKSSNHGTRSSRLQPTPAAAASPVQLIPVPHSTDQPAAAASGTAVGTSVPTSSPQQVQQSAQKNQQLAARLDELRYSAVKIKARDMSPGRTANGTSSNSRATAQRLHAAGVGGSGTLSKRAATPLSRRLFASPNKQHTPVQAVTPVPFGGPALAASAGSPVGDFVSNVIGLQSQSLVPLQEQQQGQQQQQLSAVLHQMEELLLAVQQQQAAAAQQQQQLPQDSSQTDPVTKLNQLVQQVAAVVQPKGTQQPQQQQLPQGSATSPSSVLMSAAVEHTPAPPGVSSQAAGLLLQQQTMLQLLLQQQQLLLQQQQGDTIAAHGSPRPSPPGSPAASASATAATAAAAASPRASRGRSSPYSKRAGVVIPELLLPTSEPADSMLLKQSVASSGTKASNMQQLQQQGPITVDKATDNSSPRGSQPGSSNARDAVEGSRNAGSQQPQQAANSSPGSNRSSSKVAFWRTLSASTQAPGSGNGSPQQQPSSPGAAATGAAMRRSSSSNAGSPKPNWKPASVSTGRQISTPGSPNGSTAGQRTASGSYAERFLQQKVCQQDTAATKGLNLPNLPKLGSQGAAAVTDSGLTAAAAVKGEARPVRRQWTLPSRLSAERESSVEQQDGEQQQQQEIKSIGQEASLSAGSSLPAAEAAGAVAATANPTATAAVIPDTDATMHVAAADTPVNPSSSIGGGRGTNNMAGLTANFQALNRDWQSVSAGSNSSNSKAGAATSAVSGPRASTAPGSAANRPTSSQAEATAAGVQFRKSATFSGYTTKSAAGSSGLPVAAATSAAVQGSRHNVDDAAASLEAVAEPADSTSTTLAATGAKGNTSAQDFGTNRQATNQSASGAGAAAAAAEHASSQSQAQTSEHQPGAAVSVTGTPETSDDSSSSAAAAGPAVPGLITPCTPAAAIPRVHTPGKAAAEAAAEMITPMLANSTAAVINMTEAWRQESDNTQARWKQLLDEWSADDLALTAQNEPSTDLLPSNSSATLRPCSRNTTEGGSTAEAATSEGQNIAATSSTADGAGQGVQHATHAEIREQQQQRLLRATSVSPAQAAAPSTAGSLFSPGSAVESEASEISLAAVSLQATDHQQQQQQQLTPGLQQQQQLQAPSPALAAEAPTARQLFADDSTPPPLPAVGTSQQGISRFAAEQASLPPEQQQPHDEPNRLTESSKGSWQQQWQQQLLPPEQTVQGQSLHEQNSFAGVLANLRDVHQQLAAEPQQRQQHATSSQPGRLQANSPQQPQQLVRRAAGAAERQLQTAPGSTAASWTDTQQQANGRQQLEPGSVTSAAGAERQARTAPGSTTASWSQLLSRSTAPGTASTGPAIKQPTPSREDSARAATDSSAGDAAGQLSAVIDTEDSFNQLLSNLRDVHDRLAAERCQQQLRELRASQQQQDLQNEDSFNQLLANLQEVHDKLAVMRRPQGGPVVAAAAVAAAVAPRQDEHKLQPSSAVLQHGAAAVSAAGGDANAAAANMARQRSLAVSSSKPRRVASPVREGKPSTAPPPVQMAGTFQEAAALAAAAGGGQAGLKPSQVRQAAAAAAAAAAQWAGSPQPTAAAAARAPDTAPVSSSSPSVGKLSTTDERFTVLRQKLQQSRSALQAIGVPASGPSSGTPFPAAAAATGLANATPAGWADAAASATPQPAAVAAVAGRDVSPLALPTSGWLKATPLQQYLKRSRLQQQGKPAAPPPRPPLPPAAAAGGTSSTVQQGPSQIQAMVNRWRSEAAAKTQAPAAAVHVDVLPQLRGDAPAPMFDVSNNSTGNDWGEGVEAYNTPWQQREQQQEQAVLSPLGLFPVSSLNGVGHISTVAVNGTPAAALSTEHTPAAAAAAAAAGNSKGLFGSPLPVDFAHTPISNATAASPLDLLLFPMSPLLSSSTGPAGSSAGTAAAARAAAKAAAEASTALALAGSVGSHSRLRLRTSRAATPGSQTGSGRSISSSPPSVNLLQQWERHGSPTKQLKQQLRSRAWQEQQLQQQRQQQRQQLDVAEGVMRELDRSQAALQTAAGGNMQHVYGCPGYHHIGNGWQQRQLRFQSSDISAPVTDQTQGVQQRWHGGQQSSNGLGKSPAAVLAATAAVAEDTAAALAAAAVTAGAARSVSPTSRLRKFRVQQAAAAATSDRWWPVPSQQQQGHHTVTAVAAVPVANIAPAPVLQQHSTRGVSSRTDTWLQTAAFKRQQQQRQQQQRQQQQRQQRTAAQLQTAAAGLADVRRQLAATGVAKAKSSGVKGFDGLRSRPTYGMQQGRA